MSIPFEQTLAYYRYDLPEELIAQSPLPRGEERLLVLEKKGGAFSHRRFSELPDLLPQDALLVANNSRVLPVRVLGHRPTGGKMECLILDPVPLVEASAQERNGMWYSETTVLLKPARSMRIGDTIRFPEQNTSLWMDVTVLDKGEFGRHSVIVSWKGGQNGLSVFLHTCGKLPLPPYIKREPTENDRESYQTVYSRSDKEGSAAAPTAGLHFTDAMRSVLRERGFEWTEVTLHVGYGTFAPVRENDIRTHVMHREYIECSEETAQSIAQAKNNGRPVIAVGTTACRTLEGIAAQRGVIEAFSGWTDIFIRPGFQFHVVDGMITNFHLPESTLLMLVSAMAGHDEVFEAYNSAVRECYRFFSYGDAMLIR